MKKYYLKFNLHLLGLGGCGGLELTLMNLLRACTGKVDQGDVGHDKLLLLIIQLAGEGLGDQTNQGLNIRGTHLLNVQVNLLAADNLLERGHELSRHRERGILTLLADAKRKLLLGHVAHQEVHHVRTHGGKRLLEHCQCTIEVLVGELVMSTE